ncbi:hypothetical protein L2E82_21664 [Cichorium intybus]|uniref:Uncharacterized protein n=1 Tax=Cichorium intybus TaxID=13427 RepID=A0ACB9DWI8_CICIN|nr:hypothetical protein L2E82_21664 [Cichorium intybus]
MIGSSYKRRDKLREKQSTKVVEALAAGDIQSGTGVTNDLNTTLQRKDQDIVNAMHQIRSSKDRLKEMRNEGWGTLLNDVTLFFEKNDIEIINMEDPYYNGVSRRRGSQINCLHHYRIDC